MDRFIQYIIILGIIFIAVIASLNLFKTSRTLKDSKELIESALQNVNESVTLLKKQTSLLDSLKQLNDTLIVRTRKIDSLNSIMKKNIDQNFTIAAKNISKMSKVVDSIHLEVIE